MSPVRNTRAVILVLAGIAVAGLIWRWGALRQAVLERSASRTFYEQIASDAHSVVELRSREGVADIEAGTSAAITEDAQRLINEHLSNRTRIGRVQLDAPVPLQGRPYERIRATIVLNSMSPSECAVFVHHWGLEEPMWPVASMRLSRVRSARGTHDAHSDFFDVTLSLESLIVRPEGMGE